jgi:hypothetical protein
MHTSHAWKIPGTAPSSVLTGLASDRRLLCNTMVIISNHCRLTTHVTRTTIAHTDDEADPRESSAHNRNDVHKQVDAFPIHESADQDDIDCFTKVASKATVIRDA